MRPLGEIDLLLRHDHEPATVVESGQLVDQRQQKQHVLKLLALGAILLERLGHRVERARQLAQLALAVRESGARGEIAGGDPPGRGDQRVEPAQHHAPGTAPCRERHRQTEREQEREALEEQALRALHGCLARQPDPDEQPVFGHALERFEPGQPLHAVQLGEDPRPPSLQTHAFELIPRNRAHRQAFALGKTRQHVPVPIEQKHRGARRQCQLRGEIAQPCLIERREQHRVQVSARIGQRKRVGQLDRARYVGRAAPSHHEAAGRRRAREPLCLGHRRSRIAPSRRDYETRSVGESDTLEALVIRDDLPELLARRDDIMALNLGQTRQPFEQEPGTLDALVFVRGNETRESQRFGAGGTLRRPSLLYRGVGHERDGRQHGEQDEEQQLRAQTGGQEAHQNRFLRIDERAGHLQVQIGLRRSTTAAAWPPWGDAKNQAAVFTTRRDDRSLQEARQPSLDNHNRLRDTDFLQHTIERWPVWPAQPSVPGSHFSSHPCEARGKRGPAPGWAAVVSWRSGVC